MTAIRVALPPANVAWIDPSTGRPSAAFAQAMDAMFRRTGGASEDKIDTAVTTAAGAGTAAVTAQVAADTAQTAAASANTAAATAQTAADTATTVVSVAAGYPSGLTITAAADGDNAKITISDHSMVYPDKTVSVTGTTLTGLDYNTTYSIYYDDASRAGGAVTFHAVTDGSAFPTPDHPDRIYVGGTKTPATDSDPDTTGQPKLPPGFSIGALP